ncbi:Glycosyl hydrolase family 81 C-terminal domain [Phytophthora infestans]|uniref:glucan endo-1,3-beta-D-glucosidase n=1 Tax=Phytophthora infestans TaxID=4787 RepID=A0A833T0N6_PHYIN|nr:Glycosyl hydrolase family 81 C-terminal domain [Phytophthora infestans]
MVAMGTVHAANQVQESTSTDEYFSPFATDAPSEALFQRKDGLAALAPIINVASNLLNKPIPTNKWWGNLIHTTTEDIDTVANPAWSNPYALKLPKEAPFGIQAYYSYTYRQMAGEVNGVVRYYLHEFHNDVTLSANEFGSTKPDYEVYSFSEMGVSVRTSVTGSKNCMDSALVHGMAFVSATCSTPGKYVVKLANQQTWVIFASDTGASFHITGSALVSNAVYTGTLRMAILPETGDESVYDDYASCVVRGGDVSVQSRTSYSLDWETEGSSCDSTGLLHFALPHQVEVMKEAITTKSKGAIVLHSSTRGDMVAQVTKSGSWALTEDEADEEVDFYPSTKPSADVVAQVNLLSTLQSDIDSAWSLDSGSWYYNGKAYQKYASLCLIAADSSVVGDDTALLKTCLSKLEALVWPFVNNTMSVPLVYETSYKGIVTSQVFTANDVNVEFGNGVYNDHHYHYGYWITASAILKKLNPSWSGMAQLETMVWTLLRDVVNPSLDDPHFPKLRHFSWYLGHSYSHGVTPMADGKDEESTSEDVNFFYGMILWGQVSGNKAVEDLGSLMLRLNARTVRTYFLMTSDNTIHPPQFVPNHVTGIFFDNKADYATWFGPEKYCIHGIQMIPVSPINGLARTKTFIQEEWDDILSKEAIVTGGDISNAWLSLLLVNEAVINQGDALAKLPSVTMDDGLTRSWALYNAASRGDSGSTGSTKLVTVPPSTNTKAPTVTTATPSTTTAIPSVTTATPTITTTPSTIKTKAPIATTSAPEVVTMSPISQSNVTNTPVTAAPSPTTVPSTTISTPASTRPPSPPTSAPEVNTGAKYPGWTSIPPGWTSIPLVGLRFLRAGHRILLVWSSLKVQRKWIPLTLLSSWCKVKQQLCAGCLLLKRGNNFTRGHGPWIYVCALRNPTGKQ